MGLHDTVRHVEILWQSIAKDGTWGYTEGVKNNAMTLDQLVLRELVRRTFDDKYKHKRRKDRSVAPLPLYGRR